MVSGENQQSTISRETAHICSVQELVSGEYVIQEGWKPNYVLIHGRKLSRVNIIGLVVSKPSPYEFSLDDGTGTISVNDFNQSPKVAHLKVSEPVLVVGRPRQNGTSIFIASEFVNSKQLQEEPAWISQRKQDLEKVYQNTNSEEIQFSTPVIEEPVAQPIDSIQPIEDIEPTEQVVVADVTGEDIIGFIKKKDGGDGCLVEEIISYFGKDVDEHILTLITMGEIYEIKPGKVKVLE